MIAARNAECAHEQGRFLSMHDVLYAKQDSFGIKPWAGYAREAGVPDIDRFELCSASAEPIRDLTHSLNAVKRIGAQGNAHRRHQWLVL
jgi:hypothetical protein